MTQTEIKRLLQNAVILVDTREQENRHITDWLNTNKIKHRSRKLDYGDYGIEFDSNHNADVSKKVIERKGSLTELAGNFTNGRETFEREFERAQKDNSKVVLMIEDGDYKKILSGSYRSEFTPKSYIGSLFAFSHRYGLDVQFIPKPMAGWFIYNTLIYWARENLIGG